MINKKIYEVGSIELVDIRPVTGEDLTVQAKESNSVQAPEFYPFAGDINFSDTDRFNKIAMAGPFTSP